MDWEDYNDDGLKSLEKRLKSVYQKAYKEMQGTVDSYFSKFSTQDKEMAQKVKDGKITDSDYKEWRRQKMSTGSHWTTMRDNIAKKLDELNHQAETEINETTPKVYAENYNHVQFEGDIQTGISFELTNEQAVKEALKNNHTLFKTVNINTSKDIQYNQQRLSNELASGIAQGKTWQGLAKSFQNVLNGSYSQAVRSARTSYTSAQNSGRLSGLEEFAQAGIEVQKEWLATNDDRTRASHAELDGVKVDVDKKFPNGLMYPCDPSGSPAEVYNCRCKMVSFFPNTSKDRGTGKSVETYNKWLENREEQNNNLKYKLNLQFFAKKVSDYKTVFLPKNEYAMVMSEVQTHATDKQKEQVVFSKEIRNHIYTFEYYADINDYRVIGKVEVCKHGQNKNR